MSEMERAGKSRKSERPHTQVGPCEGFLPGACFLRNSTNQAETFVRENQTFCLLCSHLNSQCPPQRTQDPERVRKYGGWSFQNIRSARVWNPLLSSQRPQAGLHKVSKPLCLELSSQSRLLPPAQYLQLLPASVFGNLRKYKLVSFLIRAKHSEKLKPKCVPLCNGHGPRKRPPGNCPLSACSHPCCFLRIQTLRGDCTECFVH